MQFGFNTGHFCQKKSHDVIDGCFLPLLFRWNVVFRFDMWGREKLQWIYTTCDDYTKPVAICLNFALLVNSSSSELRHELVNNEDIYRSIWFNSIRNGEQKISHKNFSFDFPVIDCHRPYTHAMNYLWKMFLVDGINMHKSHSWIVRHNASIIGWTCQFRAYPLEY